MIKVIVSFLLLVGLCQGQKLKIDFQSSRHLEFKPLEELPSTIPSCSQNDMNINECIKSGFQEIISRVKEGIEELGIPSLDPFVVEKIGYQFTHGLVKGRAEISNLRVHGISEARIKSVNFHMANDKINLETFLTIPRLYIEGNYKAAIKVNNMNLTPKGVFNITVSKVKMTAKPEGELYHKGDHTYLKLLKFNATPEIGDMKIFATGFSEDPTLNALILEFFNQNWREINNAFMPAAAARWDSVLLKVTNDFFAALPFDFILKSGDSK